MTISDLKNDVLQLGFDSYIENEKCFIASANRALSLIYVDRPVTKTAVISFHGPRGKLVSDFIEHTSGDEISFSISGKSLSFRSMGKGTCIITDRTGSNTVPLSAQGQHTKQFINGDTTVTFKGDYYFTISNFAVFEDLVSNNSSDIPDYTTYREVEVKDFASDFRAFAGHPKDSSGALIESVELADGIIRTPYDYRGEMYLTYYRSPATIIGDSPSKVIDISEECVPLLPLLTASFMWLDDDAAKAQYYMSLYRDMVSNIRRFSNNKIIAEYRTNGWA